MCAFFTLSSRWDVDVKLCSSGGTGVLWWLYVDHRLYGNHTDIKDTKEEESNGSSSQELLVYAIAATVFTVQTSTGSVHQWIDICAREASRADPGSVRGGGSVADRW